MGERTEQTLQAGSPGRQPELDTHHSFPGVMAGHRCPPSEVTVWNMVRS